MRSKATRIQCASCGKASLARKRVDHDIGPLIDMERVFVEGLPALVCPKCGAVTVEGAVLEQISILLAIDIIERAELTPRETRYLRKMLGDTQEELAQRLGVARITVNRWENGPERLVGPGAYALRSHVFFRLRQENPIVESVASAFIADHPRPPAARGDDYNIHFAARAAN